MKIKPLTLLVVLVIVLAGCKLRQPIKTPVPTGNSATSSDASPSASADMTVPKLPDRFANLTPDKLTLKVYDIKTKKTNEMNVEEYLYGVLAGEMRQDWPQEALKAQAIIARTFLMDFLNTNTASGVKPDADISTDPKESQAYDPTGINDNIKKAVDETRGMVIAYNGQFIKAWFHSASGGKTADAVEGLNYKEGNPPYIQSVDSDESKAPAEFENWENTFTSDEILAGLKKTETQVTGVSVVSLFK